tara:strand:+ start:4510 stop:4839 length:330 start_codon:yes stop_codon:yes gene_type:complete
MADKYNRREPPSNAKLSNAKQSSESIAITHINNLTKQLAKSFNHRYQQAKHRNALNPVQELERRVLRKVQPMWSTDRYLELCKALYTMTPFEKMEFLRRIETSLPKRRR